MKKQWMVVALGLLLFGLLPGLRATAQIGLNFTASTFGTDTAALPADTMGAIGPNHFVEFINGQFAVFSRTNGDRLLAMTDIKFWTNAGVTFGKSVTVTDPRVLYDPDSGRWFASMVDLNMRREAANRFLLAVSSNSDPTGSWHALAFPSAAEGSYFADFPTLGVDSNGVYLSGDLFTLLEDEVGPIIVSIPKDSLLTDQPTTNGMVFSAVQSYDTRGYILQPTVVRGSTSGPEIFVGVGNLGEDFQTHSTLVLSPVYRTNGTFSLGAPVVLNVPSYEIPLNPIQPGGSETLDDGDTRFSAYVIRVGNIIYATHNTEVGTYTAIRWYRIDATALTLIESGTITNPGLDFFYPSIAANTNGAVVIGCNGTGTNTYVSSFAFVGQVTNGVLSFGEPMLLKEGEATYDTHDAEGISRWGDYSATTVDPNDQTHFWTIQCFPVDSVTYATQVTEIIVAGGTNNPAPSLTITLTASGIEISWPAGAGQTLQFTPTILSPNWQPVPGTPTVSNGVSSQVVTADGGSAFYRVVSF